MLRHTGQARTFAHNVRIAALLCLTAGFVNVSGFVAFMVLTTNVTGHVAVFADKLSQGDISGARVVGLWMLLFLLGAFTSSLIVNVVGRNKQYSYVIPVVVEFLILFAVGSSGYLYDHTLVKTEIFAGSLLFAMGMQNAMVSIISGSVVRTTHLTGMFTDLGIELSSVIQEKGEVKNDLKRKIKLRLVIIVFFFLGGIAGGYLFKLMHYQTFYVPAGILLLTLFYDIFRVRGHKLVRDAWARIHGSTSS